MRWHSLGIAAGLVASLAFGSQAIAACQLAPPVWSTMEVRSVTLTQDSAAPLRIRSRIADTLSKRAAGFQHVCPEIIELNSILFIFERPIRSKFHMFNVHDELDIGFFDDSKVLIEVLQMTPQDRSQPNPQYYSPGGAFQYALEARAGFFADHQLEPGKTRLEYP